jgi:transcriptional regulator with XRE-family HTH domain
MTKHDIDGYVGKRLKQRRTIMGLSQEAVAKAVGITFQQVQKYEKGSNAMNANRLFEFSRFMNVPVAYFFEGIEQNPSPHNMSVGFAETPALEFDNDSMASDRESLEMMKSFKRIKEPVVRKRIADLLRAISDNKTLLD